MKARIAKKFKKEDDHDFSFAEKLKKWKKNLNNNNGTSRTIEENELLVQEIIHYLLQGKTLDKTIKTIIDIHGGAYRTYQQLWNHFLNNENCNYVETLETRGRKNDMPNYIDEISK